MTHGIREWQTDQYVETILLFSQGRSQYEANGGTCLSHLRVDPGSVLFQRGHHKDPE